jgi:hypothetical protein
MKNFVLALAVIVYIIVIGGGIYEHVTTVPRWSAAPPASLSMFQGEYGVNAAPFWQSIHPVAILLMVVSLVLNWKTPRKKYILGVLATYIIVLMVTFAFFVPELLSIITTPYEATVSESLQARAATWEKLSLVRIGVMIVSAYFLVLSLTKDTVKTQ